MKKILLFLFVVLLIISVGSCSKEQVPAEQQQLVEEQQTEDSAEETVVDYTTSDFTPPTGKAEGVDDGNPQNSRMLFATSEDGLTWTKTNQLIADQANVPSVTMDSEGRIFVYQVTWAEGLEDSAVVAISEDKGETWVFKKVIVDGIGENMKSATDPCIVQLEDGTVRLYFTSEIQGVGYPEVFSATSNDGINFVLEEGSRFSTSKAGDRLIDPTVLKIGETWHLYTLYLGGSEGNFHATSEDGLTFTEEDPKKRG